MIEPGFLVLDVVFILNKCRFLIGSDSTFKTDFQGICQVGTSIQKLSLGRFQIIVNNHHSNFSRMIPVEDVGGPPHVM